MTASGLSVNFSTPLPFSICFDGKRRSSRETFLRVDPIAPDLRYNKVRKGDPICNNSGPIGFELYLIGPARESLPVHRQVGGAEGSRLNALAFDSGTSPSYGLFSRGIPHIVNSDLMVIA